jgi:hypothetical protein
VALSGNKHQPMERKVSPKSITIISPFDCRPDGKMIAFGLENKGHLFTDGSLADFTKREI